MNRLRIKKLGIWSIAKLYAVIGLVVGLLIGVPYGIIIILVSLISAGGNGGDAAFAIGGGGVVVGVVAMIGFPIMYSLFLGVGGAVGAILYNLFSAMIGGIEIEVEQIV